MKYIRLKTTDPYYNLAVEEYLFHTASEDIFMLWQNEPSVIVGKNQNIYAEADVAAAKRGGIRLCRRITGGGAVYHDLGNINYTFISTGGAVALDFDTFTRPIRNALADMGAPSTLGGRNDIECLGKKVSGNAQHAAGERILHHGTLLFDTDFSVMESVLRVDKEKLDYRAIKSCGARVANLSGLIAEKMTVEEFISRLEERVCRELFATPIELSECAEIEKICERNKTDAWIYSDKKSLTAYTVSRKKKYPFGLVTVQLLLEREVIRDISISGDFFGTQPIKELEDKLIGIKPEELSEIDPAPYISGMTEKELASLLRGDCP